MRSFVRIYRFLSYGLCMVSFIQLVIVLSLRFDQIGWTENIWFFGLFISFNEFLVLAASVSKGLCCFFGRKKRQ